MDFFRNSAKEFEYIRDKIKGKMGKMSKMGSKFGGQFPKNTDEASNKIKIGINKSSKNLAGAIDNVTHAITKNKSFENKQGGTGRHAYNKNAKRKRKLKKQKNKHVFRSRKKCIKINLSSTRKKK